MARAQVRDHRPGLTVRLGHNDAAIPEPLAGFVRDQLAAPRRHHSLGAPPDTRWLFPGHLPGQPITARTWTATGPATTSTDNKHAAPRCSS